ncbi:protein scarlet-like [Eriocheir sinensis]|uniref:protein scarlet-like n=1 Tax=Eriocheir sinensis TaxID=95602 RepID=UPI0021C6C5E1|nr:protein scarlet-like [Eriocheir sinensis]XP_050716454.1 protein scarlet-like [Eriocheir sinensis]XP_050716456.1 protein scarlet-like [Eriocheir sinensis]
MSDIESESGEARRRLRSLARDQFVLTGNPNLLGLPYYTHLDGLAGRDDDNESLLDSAQFLGHYDDSDTGSGSELTRRAPSRYGTWKSVEDGITLTWRDMSVYVPQKKTWYKASGGHKPFKLVLNSVSGAVRPGSLVALMGASGAGKSTLMNALAHRTPGEVMVDGDILVNGHRANRSMNALSGYVHQDDLFVASLTVKEHLTFMARLRMDVRTTANERRGRVHELLKELGLTKVQHSRIGAPGLEKSLSGGERKRLAFATEILTDPPLLFCDEPTTGLDSFNARKLVKMMKEMAARGKTILCTIHQPSTEVFLMFDKLMLLAEGRLAYIGSSNGALEFLDGLGHKCPSTFNPADFYIHTLAVQPGHELRSRERIKRICDNFAVSPYAKDVELIIQHQDNKFQQYADMQKSYDGAYNCAASSSTNSSSSTNESIVQIVKHIPKLPGWWIQLYWLWWRAVIDSYRNPAVHGIRILQKFVMALLIGMCYSGVEINQRGIQDIEGVLFIYITENTFPSVYAVLNVFPLELPLFLREYKNGIYRCDTYYIAKMAALMPGFFLDPMIFVCICYWLVGLRPRLYTFLMTIVVLIFTTNTASSCGAMFSAMFESLPYAMVMLVPFLMMLLITGGLMVNLGSLSPYIGWVKYLSWFMYSNEALTTLQWEGVKNITCETGPNVPCLKEGDAVIHRFTFSESHLPLDLICMAILYLTFHSIGFCGLLSRARRK